MIPGNEVSAKRLPNEGDERIAKSITTLFRISRSLFLIYSASMPRTETLENECITARTTGPPRRHELPPEGLAEFNERNSYTGYISNEEARITRGDEPQKDSGDLHSAFWVCHSRDATVPQFSFPRPQRQTLHQAMPHHLNIYPGTTEAARYSIIWTDSISNIRFRPFVRTRPWNFSEPLISKSTGLSTG